MSHFVVSALVIFFLVVFGFILLALRSCESPSNGSQETNQYPATLEETTSSESVQYDNRLPDTGGLKW